MSESTAREKIGIPETARQNALYWLGQAGFWIDLAGVRILIDPYLSNSLGEKYAGTKFPHVRMMEIPVLPQDLPRPDIVLITHGHTDHMDEKTLRPLAERHSGLKFVVPAAEEALARSRIGDQARLETVQAGDEFALGSGVVTVLPSAHEERKQDISGRDHYLGYGISLGNIRIYHSGDSVPFDDLSDWVNRFGPDVALLPVNGRDEERASNGIPGNMTLDEAVELCQKCAIERLVPHHFGLFEFNTANEAELKLAQARTSNPKIDLPSPLRPIPLG